MPEKLNFTSLEQRLLNDFQHGFPLVTRPYLAIAEQLGMEEDEVIDLLADLRERGAISRVGPVFKPNRVGVSTLAAMAVPPDQLAAVAEIVNSYPEVNHNYERDHHFNLWFVLTAPESEHLNKILQDIRYETGLEVMDLPMVQDYFIDLGFTIQWT